MGLLERIKSLLASNLNEVLDKAEDPEKALNQLIREMEEDLREAKHEVASAARDERHLADELADAKDRAEQMQRKAIMAVERGEDDLAREALRRKRSAQRLQLSLEAQWAAQKESVDALRAHLEGLELKIQEAKRRRDLFIARRRLAQARKGVHETASHFRGLTEPDFDRLDERVTDMEVEAEATAELTAGLVESRFEKLAENSKKADEELEQELARIKEQVARRQAKRESQADS